MSVNLTSMDARGYRWSSDHTVSVRAASYRLAPFGHDPGSGDGYEVRDRMAETTMCTRTLKEARLAVAAILDSRGLMRLQWSEWIGNRNIGWKSYGRQSGGRTPGVEVWVAGLPRVGGIDAGLYDLIIETARHAYGWLVEFPTLKHRQEYVRAHAENIRWRETHP